MEKEEEEENALKQQKVDVVEDILNPEKAIENLMLQFEKKAVI